MDPHSTNLRFVEADRLDTAAGRLNDAVVVTPRKTPLGTLDGVLVDASRCAVEYLVVGARRWFTSRHYLVPLRTARLASDAHEIEVDLDDDALSTLPSVNPRTLAELPIDEVPRAQAA
jgi:hypothetical protein